MADYQNLSAPELNQINGSSSALGEGTFKRRDELRRAESVQRNRVRMSERLDRNITRAVRKGDANSARAFNALKESITGQGYMGGGGIVNAEDQQDRVKDGAVKAADTRYNMGNIGNTSPADGPIANAPPPVGGRPRVVGQFPPGSDLEKAEKDLWTKPKPGARHDDEYMSMDAPQSVKDSIAGPQTSPEATPAPSSSPSATLSPKALKSRQAFAADLDRSTLVQTDPAARERAYKRGESIGVSREEVDRRQQWSKPVLASEFAVAPEPNPVAVASEAPSSFESLTQGTPKRKKDSPLVAAYNQKPKAPSLSRESVFGPLGSKSKLTRSTPKESGDTQSFGAALIDDAKSVYEATQLIRDIPGGIRQQIRYGALDAVGMARKTYAAAQETGPSMIAQHLPGAVGEWAKKKTKDNFQALGKRSRAIDDSILKMKNAITRYAQPPSPSELPPS